MDEIRAGRDFNNRKVVSRPGADSELLLDTKIESNLQPHPFLSRILMLTILTRAALWSAIGVILLASSSAAATLKQVERFEVFSFAGIHLLANRTTVEETPSLPDLDGPRHRGLARMFAST